MTLPSGPRAAVGHGVISTEHHVVRLGVALLAGRDLDVHDHPPIERDDEAGARAVGFEPADNRRRAALEDAQDAALGAACR